MSTATATAVPPDYDRTPPNDVAAEQCVLGAMLLSKDAIADVVERLQGQDFYAPKHLDVFECICDLYSRGEPADAITVASALATADVQRFVRNGGASYLHDLVNAVPTAANAGYYADIVHDRAKLRRLIAAGTRVVQYGYSGSAGVTDVDDLIDMAQQAVYDVGDDQRGDGFVALADLLQPTIDEIEAIGAAEGAMRGIPTGFTDLDRLLNGLQGGQLVIVAGRPSMGKSTLAVDILRNSTIKHGYPGALFSLEMSKIEVAMRILSAEARVPLHVLRSGQPSDDDWTKLARRMGEISEAALFVDDTPNMNLMEIRAKARRLKQRNELKLIVVDYLGLMSSAKRAENRQQEVADISRGLKLLAKEIDLPVIAVHQLNRNSEQRGKDEKRPQMSDLRDSGALEQDADIVILIHRDDYYDKESPRAGEADFIVAKNRNGPTDTVTVAAQLHLSRFVDMAIG